MQHIILHSTQEIEEKHENATQSPRCAWCYWGLHTEPFREPNYRHDDCPIHWIEHKNEGETRGKILFARKQQSKLLNIYIYSFLSLSHNELTGSGIAMPRLENPLRFGMRLEADFDSITRDGDEGVRAPNSSSSQASKIQLDYASPIEEVDMISKQITS